MSYDLAVREGERPADDKIAGQVFSDPYDRYTDSEEEEPPSERIAAYVAVLLERWCDLTEDDEDPSPWSTGPLMPRAHARGPRATHLSLVRSRWLMPNSTFGSSYRKGYPTMSAAAMKTPLGM
ncbi:hypothetical protein GCM10010095_70830 [Streptomyces anthocyanicus]|uniref:Uncharacterized protein n=1 Tax=Streptomyces violaceolatus TaxID=67378 RepID=A0ABN3TBI5_9ACTN|nr:hypothetical protein GCM10010095_70830 [Streptomyces anthocyanicus]